MAKSKSTKVFLIEEYYRTLGDKLSWDSRKVRDLCGYAKISLEELAAYMRMRPDTLLSKLSKGFNRQESLLLYQASVKYGYYTPFP